MLIAVSFEGWLWFFGVMIVAFLVASQVDLVLPTELHR